MRALKSFHSSFQAPFLLPSHSQASLGRGWETAPLAATCRMLNNNGRVAFTGHAVCLSCTYQQLRFPCLDVRPVHTSLLSAQALSRCVALTAPRPLSLDTSWHSHVGAAGSGWWWFCPLLKRASEEHLMELHQPPPELIYRSAVSHPHNSSSGVFAGDSPW